MRRYVVQAVFNDSDYGFIGNEVSFRTKRSAVKRWESMEARRKEYDKVDWHYEVRDTKTNSVVRPLRAKA